MISMVYKKPKPTPEGKRFEVIKATTKEMGGIGDYKFGPNGSFTVSDPGVANEIEQEFGHKSGSGDVVVSPVTIAEPGHKYSFGYSKSFSENYERIFSKKRPRGPHDNLIHDPAQSLPGPGSA